jgi:transposase-like protein
MVNFKRSQFEREIILWTVRWYVVYSLSYRQLEELLSEYGVTVGYEAVRLWCLQCASSFAKKLRHNRLSYNAAGRYDPEAQDTRRHA